MVNESLATAAFSVCAALIAVLLRQYAREQSMLAALGACAVIMGGFMRYAAPMLEELREIFAVSGVPDSCIAIVFKAGAVSFITQISGGICRDSGESAIGAAAELWGRGAIIFMTLPVLRVLLDRINEIL